MKNELRRKILKLKLASALGITLATSPNMTQALASPDKPAFNIEIWWNPKYADKLYEELKKLPHNLDEYLLDYNSAIILLEGGRLHVGRNI